MYMKIVISQQQLDKLVKKVKPKDGAKFIKCDSCRKLFTQTIHKGKKSLPICPWCGRHNNQVDENQEVDERSRSFAFTRKKRLFSKAELMANPGRYRKHERDLKEIDRYKFSEPRSSGKPSPEEYKEVLSTSTFIKSVGSLSYFYIITDEETIPTVRFFILDTKNKEFVGYADFEVRYGSEFFVSIPYVRKEYRNMGVATEIYKIALTMGNVVSGKAQSEQAVGLWKKMFKELPNKMIYIDDNGDEFGVYEKNGELYTTKTDMSVYDTRGGYLRLNK